MKARTRPLDSYKANTHTEREREYIKAKEERAHLILLQCIPYPALEYMKNNSVREP